MTTRDLRSTAELFLRPDAVVWLSPESVEDVQALARAYLAVYPADDGEAITENANGRIAKAILVAVKYGGIDGAHHKAWVIDQMVRALAGGDYDNIVAQARCGVDGPETYDWDTGIAP